MELKEWPSICWESWPLEHALCVYPVFIPLCRNTPQRDALKMSQIFENYKTVLYNGFKSIALAWRSQSGKHTKLNTFHPSADLYYAEETRCLSIWSSFKLQIILNIKRHSGQIKKKITYACILNIMKKVLEQHTSHNIHINYYIYSDMLVDDVYLIWVLPMGSVGRNVYETRIILCIWTAFYCMYVCMHVLTVNYFIFINVSYFFRISLLNSGFNKMLP